MGKRSDGDFRGSDAARDVEEERRDLVEAERVLLSEATGRDDRAPWRREVTTVGVATNVERTFAMHVSDRIRKSIRRMTEDDDGARGDAFHGALGIDASRPRLVETDDDAIGSDFDVRVLKKLDVHRFERAFEPLVVRP